MDVVVTLPDPLHEGIPALQLHYSLHPTGQLYFRVPFLPKNSSPGDRCHVVSNSFVIGSHLIVSLTSLDDLSASSIGPDPWPPGFYIVRDAQSFLPQHPLLPYPPFRSFRYFSLPLLKGSLTSDSR